MFEKVNNFRISISGDLGSGKSTVCGILSKRHNLAIVSAGSIQREIAKNMGITIEQLNIYMEKDSLMDKKLDDYLASYDKKDGNFIFDSRLAWHFIPSTTSFYLKVDPQVAAKRVYLNAREDEGYQSVEEAFRYLKSRRESELLRYKKFYDLDLVDMSNYDCVIDTTNISAEQVSLIIENEVAKRNR